MGAPTCNINVKPPAPAGNIIQAPSIPIATDPASTMAAVNALRQAWQVFTNQYNNTTNNQGGGFGASASNFQVVNQVTKTTRIYDPNDPTKKTYVDVNQIVSLSMQNPVTKESWTWTQPAQAGSNDS